MTLTQILFVLRARWGLALMVLIVVVASVAAASLLRTPQYTASASVVLDVKSPDPIVGAVLPGMTMAGYMGTQLGILQSERVALGALKRLKIDQDPALQKQWSADTGGVGDFHAWLSDSLLHRLDVIPARDSNVITVAYTSPSPVFAASAANAFVQSYIDTTLELRVEPARQFNNFFDDSAKSLRDALDQAQNKLSAYERANGIIASDARLDVENTRLIELSTQLVQMQAIATESGSRQSQSGANAERMQEVLNSPLLVGLNTELARQEGRLMEMTTKLGDNNPQVVELTSSVAQLRARVASETRRVASSLVVTNNVNQARLAQLRASVEAQRTRLLGLKSQRDEASLLKRDVESAQRAYEMVQSRASQSGVESQATQTNVSVLKQATPPARPSSPRIPLNIAAGVLVGGLLALGAVLVREAFDRRLRMDSDVVQGLRTPLLGVLPVKARARGKARTGAHRMAQGLQALAPTPGR